MLRQPTEPASHARFSSVIQWQEHGGSGSPLHFLHANGYPPACYRPLLQRLAAQHRVFGMLLRPLWPGTDPGSIQDWRPFSDDLQQLLRQRGEGPAVGVGHSIGAIVTLRTALHQPALFRALVLIDPVLLPPRRIMQLRILRALGLSSRLNRRIEASLQRRRHFDDLEQLFSGYRRREIFRFLSDDGLRTLIAGMTRSSEQGGYDLVYSPEWEARIYETAIWNDRDIWDGLPSLRVPTLVIRGSHTDTFWARTARLVQQRNPAIRTVTVPNSTHLVALERPDEVAQVTRAFLHDAVLSGS
jgi:pimeloyl-ACP methyl ester carboxylesterase